MIPTTFAGLLLLVATLVPGFIYLERRESRHAGRDFSALRETSVVVVTSAVTIAIVVLLFGGARWVAPGSTPEIGRYVRDGGTYAKDHYLEALVWLAVGLLAASILAYCAAIPPAATERAAKLLPRRGQAIAAWLSRRRGAGPISQASGWTSALDALPKTEQWLSVVLTDGVTVRGRRGSHSTQIEETTDRDLVLAAPLAMKGTDGQWTDLSPEGTLVVNASRIHYFTVRYSRRASSD